MRALVDRSRLERFMQAPAENASRQSRVYLTGGSSAVLLGWRDATVDIDLEIIPEDDRALRAIRQEKSLAFYHYDLYAQALSKIERFHARDVLDVQEMIRRGLVEPKLLLSLFDRIVPELYRFPSLDPLSFRKHLETSLAQIIE